MSLHDASKWIILGDFPKQRLLEFGYTSNCSPILPFTPSNHIFKQYYPKSILELSILPLRVAIELRLVRNRGFIMVLSFNLN